MTKCSSKQPQPERSPVRNSEMEWRSPAACRTGAVRTGRSRAGRGDGDQSSPRCPLSCWLTPAASQIPVENWAAREMSSRTLTSVPAHVRCRITLPSRPATIRAMPSGLARARPFTGTTQFSRLMSPLTKSPLAGRPGARAAVRSARRRGRLRRASKAGQGSVGRCASGPLPPARVGIKPPLRCPQLSEGALTERGYCHRMRTKRNLSNNDDNAYRGSGRACRSLCAGTEPTHRPGGGRGNRQRAASGKGKVSSRRPPICSLRRSPELTIFAPRRPALLTRARKFLGGSHCESVGLFEEVGLAYAQRWQRSTASSAGCGGIRTE